MSPTKKKAKSKKNHTQPSVSNKRKNDGYVSVKYDEKKSYANVVLIVIVGILLLYLFLKYLSEMLCCGAQLIFDTLK